MSKANRRVLLVCLNKQHNSANLSKSQIDDEATVFDLLTTKGLDTKAAIQPNPNFAQIIPGDDLIVVAAERMDTLDCRVLTPLDALGQASNPYDFVIVDCPPTLGLVPNNALIAADEVIVQMLCDGFSIFTT